jgi:tRNA 2-thiouridine synthesizing protein A
VGQRRRRPGGQGGGRLLSQAPAVVDLSGAEDFCADPTPLERVRRAYADLEPGQRLEVRTTVEEHAFAVRAWSRKSGVALLEDRKDSGVTRLLLERGS